MKFFRWLFPKKIATVDSEVDQDQRVHAAIVEAYRNGYDVCEAERRALALTSEEYEVYRQKSLEDFKKAFNLSTESLRS